MKVENWQALVASGVWIGNRNAENIVLEFADFECPFCKRFHDAYSDARLTLPDTGNVALVFVHLPIPGHRFARPAARAAMCAENQGRFTAFHDAIYAQQDSLGLKPWVAYAADAGVPDLRAFEKCNASTQPVQLVERGVALAESLNVKATPTVIVNGWRYSSPPVDSLAILLRRNHAGGAKQ